MTRSSLVPVLLPADPTANLQAATKQYIDNLIWNLPRGIVAKGTLNITSGSTKTIPTATYSAASEVSTLSFTTIANRRYRLRYFVRACDAKGCNAFLWVDGVQSGAVTDPWLRVEGTWNSWGIDFLFDSSGIAAGAHTFNIRISNQSGVTATFYADAASYVVLEDLGPTSAGILPAIPPQTGVLTPAYAGARSDNTVDAIFRNMSEAGNEGFISSAGGSHYIINAFGQNFGVFQKDVGGTYAQRFQVSTRPMFFCDAIGNTPQARGAAATWVLEYRDNAARELHQYANNGFYSIWDSSVGDMLYLYPSKLRIVGGAEIGLHPVHTGYIGIWRDGGAAAGSYALIQDGSANTLLNAATSMGIRIGNQERITIAGTIVSRVAHYHDSYLFAGQNAGASVDWGNAPIQTTSSGNSMPRIAFWCPNIAPQLRANTAYGDHLEVINNPGSAYANIRAAAFPVASSLAFKEDVRPIRIRDLPPALNDKWDDKVGTLDIMALRPVAFRPKVGALEILPTDKDKPIDGADSTTWFNKERDHSTWLGHQGHRERLGLIAEEVENVLPSAVDHYEDGTHGAIDYAQIVVAMLDHVQRLTDEVSTLRYRISELENA